MLRRLMFLALVAICTSGAFAQKQVSGTVVDAAGEPIIGASVIVKGTSTGTVTDFNGSFTLQNVSDKASLVISYVGFRNQTVAVSGKSQFDVVLEEDRQLVKDEIAKKIRDGYYPEKLWDK